MHDAWSTPEVPPPLLPGTAQVWCCTAPPVPTEGARAVLTDGEQSRAARMRAGLPRAEFVAGRVLLRRLLGRILGCAPGSVALATGAHGRPELPGETGVCFNVAHAHGCVLVALGCAGALGVDVEFLDRSVEAEALARAHFHPEEAALIAAASPTLQAELFLRCWTRKEAVLKADGRGLGASLGFSVLPLTPARGRAVSPPATGGVTPEVLFLHDLPVSGRYCAALAVPERETNLQLFHASAAILG